MSGKTIARVIMAVLGGVALGGMIQLAIAPRPFLPPLPVPPIITAERGDLPTGIVAFEARIRSGPEYALVGSGFLLALPGGDVIGVTTAHSLAGREFAPMVFTPAGRDEPAATFSRLYVPRGQPRTGADLTVDYVLLAPDASPASLVLRADPRGAPQPGERVLLFSGLGDGHGGQRILPGIVESVDRNGAWVRMSSPFDPGLMSGSPVLSQHTGRVVGMTIAMSLRPGALMIGVNPVGAILSKATSH